jgi:predicted O-methyltransferase YrrM
VISLGRGTRVANAFARNPREALERALDQFAERHDRQHEPPHYAPDPDWPATLEHALGSNASAEAAAEFDDVWHDVQSAFAELRLPFGRAAFGGWDDGDPALARAAWYVVRLAQPSVVVETGVGRGVTTRVILEALARNGQGRLWSIDVPPLLEHDLADETAAVVPDAHRDRWTLVHGSSRTQLRALLAELGYVDVFLHDSFHTARNLLFEWETAASWLRPSGVLLADDVHRNAALADFTQAHPSFDRIVCRHDDGEELFAVLVARN